MPILMLLLGLVGGAGASLVIQDVVRAAKTRWLAIVFRDDRKFIILGETFDEEADALSFVRGTLRTNPNLQFGVAVQMVGEGIKEQTLHRIERNELRGALTMPLGRRICTN